jgi:diacylglycerol kinase family enzyme
VDENPAVAKGDEIDHALQLLARILHFHPTRQWSITLDGRHLSGEYLLVEAMNIPLIGPNIPLSPNADPGDGQIDLVTLTEDQRDAFLAYIADRLAGNASPPEFTVHRGRRLQLFSAERELHVDDDLWPDESGDGSRRSHPAGEEGAALEISLESGALEVLASGA